MILPKFASELNVRCDQTQTVNHSRFKDLLGGNAHLRSEMPGELAEHSLGTLRTPPRLGGYPTPPAKVA